jgi:hypothetical protein
MGFLIIIIALLVLWAHKSGRPMKLVLTPEEAKAVRAKWWWTAWFELKLWAGAFVLGYALAGNALASEHWHWSIYALIVWCSLVLFSRLAIWITFAGVAALFALASIAKALLHYTIQGPPLFGPLVIATILAILVRFFFMFWKPAPGGPKSPSEQKDMFPAASCDGRVYDHETDTYVYKEGNREPAHIRWPRDEDRRENVCRRRDEDDYFERKRADDYYSDQLRRRE